MNKELLRKLQLQAGGSHYPDINPQIQEKFAELIVGECSRIADDWVNNEDNGENYPSDKIKQHFGVEE